MSPVTRMPVDALVEQLLAEPDLWPDLLALDEPDTFIDKLVTLATTWDIELSSGDVRQALATRRREWLERWI